MKKLHEQLAETEDEIRVFARLLSLSRGKKDKAFCREKLNKATQERDELVSKINA